MVPCLRNLSLQVQDDLWGEVPRLIVPLQDRLTRICRLLHGGDERCIGEYRMAWAIDHAQRVLGDCCWAAMDEQDPNWLDERFDELSEACGLES